MPKIFDEDRWVSQMRPDDVSLCFRCERDTLDGNCEAYPDGIPFEILTNEVDHRKPYKNDSGLIFKEIVK